MAYCLPEDIEKLLPRQELVELTTESGTSPDLTVAAECISRAEAEIDSYVGVRYQVPLTTVPARVKALAVDLAVYHLFSRRSAVPEVREKNYQRALSFLREVAAGRAVLMDGGAEVPRSGGTLDLNSKAARLFSRQKLVEY